MQNFTIYSILLSKIERKGNTWKLQECLGEPNGHIDLETGGTMVARKGGNYLPLDTTLTSHKS